MSTKARSAGLIDQRLTSRRTPSGSITPTRSFPGKTSGCSTIPLATTTRPARILSEHVPVGDRHEAVLEEPDRGRRREELDARVERAPLELRGATVAFAVGEQRAADVESLLDEEHLVTGAAARAIAASRPRLPAADHEHVGVPVLDLDALAAGAPCGSSLPSPAAPRSSFSYSGQSRRGRMNVL